MKQGTESNAGAAQRVQIGSGVAGVQKTPEDIMQRYRECRLWRLVPKEYLFRYLIQGGVKGKRVLDFGCGTGEATTQLAMLGGWVTGLDVLPELVDIARTRAELDGYTSRCEFVTAAIELAGLPPESFDFVVCNAVLHHVDLSIAIPALLNCLKPGGALVVVEPIAFSQTLQRVRDRTPVPKGDLDPGEQQLSREDIRYIQSAIDVSDVVYFRLLERLTRVAPKLWRPLIHLDRAVLSIFPFLSRYAGTIVIIGTKPASVKLKL